MNVPTSTARRAPMQPRQHGEERALLGRDLHARDRAERRGLLDERRAAPRRAACRARRDTRRARTRGETTWAATARRSSREDASRSRRESGASRLTRVSGTAYDPDNRHRWHRPPGEHRGPHLTRRRARAATPRRSPRPCSTRKRRARKRRPGPKSRSSSPTTCSRASNSEPVTFTRGVRQGRRAACSSCSGC